MLPPGQWRGMTPNQPPEWQHDPRLRPVDTSAALAALGPDVPSNPVAVGKRFLDAVTDHAGPQVHVLRELVTPESRATWGDFRRTAQQLAGCGMTSKAEPAAGTDQIVYVRYVSSPDYSLRSEGEVPIMARAIGTMVYRPDLGGWKVHSVGTERIPPERIPR